MDILDKLEKMSEKIVEGVFKKGLKSNVQPIEIAKFITRIMKEDKVIGVDQVIVPDNYQIFLSKLNYQHLKPVEQDIKAEINTYLARFMQERSYITVQPIVLQFVSSKELREGDFQVESSISQESSVSEHTMIFNPVSSKTQKMLEKKPVGELVVVKGSEAGMVFRVSNRATTIGRRNTSDIFLNDDKCSRVHAKILVEDSKFVIMDVGSTNGTRVNQRVIIEKELKDGDLISIGEHVLKFRVVE